MTMQVHLDDTEAGQVATNTGWADYIDWASGLPTRPYGEVIHLAAHGWCQHLPALRDQLLAAVAVRSPGSSAGSVVTGLLKLLGSVAAEGAEVLTVSDGVGDES